MILLYLISQHLNLIYEGVFLIFYKFRFNFYKIQKISHSILFQKRKLKYSQQLQFHKMEKSDKIVVSKLKKIAIISLIFMTIQIVGGALANSIAIMADAFHLFSDVVAYMVSLYAVLLSKKIAPKNLAFGYEKAQPLGALINVAIIWCVTIQLFIQATRRIISKQIVQQPFYMLLTSIFGLGCNLFIMKILHSSQDGQCGHNHSNGGHSHQSHSHKDHSHHQDHSHQNHSHKHHSHQNGQKDHKNCNKQNKKQKQMPCCSNKQHIQAVCSCKSADQMARYTDYSQNQNNKTSKGSIDIQNQIPIQLGEDLVPKSKHKGYCVVHSNDKHHHHDHNHDHKHDHDHEDDNKKKNRFQNINIQAAYIHIISDIILSIGVIVSASIIYFAAGDDRQWTAWQLADPFCTYLFSIVALYSTISIVKQSFTILLDGCENPQLLSKIDHFVHVLKQKNKNLEIQDVKVWSSNRGKYYAL